jgi:hypothetical protein
MTDWKGLLKEVIIAYFNVLSWYSFERMIKIHENFIHDYWNPSDILLEYLPNTGLEFDLYTNVLSSVPD